MEKNRIDFIDDYEKMRDFHKLTKEEFLASYSYLTPMEYDATALKEKETLYAINIALAIIEQEDFVLDLWEVNDDLEGTTQELVFCLEDEYGANLGDIQDDIFYNLAQVLDRMDIYHNDYFYSDIQDRLSYGEDIPQDDYCRKLIIILESDYCYDLFKSISTSLYTNYVKTDFSLEVKDRVAEIDWHEALDYLINKTIANKVIDTQSAYAMIEVDNKVYLSHYGYADNFSDSISSQQALYQDVMLGNCDQFTSFDSYKEVLDSEVTQIVDDMYDMGIYNENGKYNFYLSKNELEYIGLGDALHEYDYKKETQATNLPNGWKWIDYNDLSGHLLSPTGKTYFSYDWTTYEYKVNEKDGYELLLDDDTHRPVSLKDFKEYAENYINDMNIENVKANREKHKSRQEEILSKAFEWFAEHYEGAELLNILREHLDMTDNEIVDFDLCSDELLKETNYNDNEIDISDEY